jgi:hypothetical protein
MKRLLVAATAILVIAFAWLMKKIGGPAGDPETLPNVEDDTDWLADWEVWPDRGDTIRDGQ